MGIFSRIFQRGQDGSASDASDDNGNAMNNDSESGQAAPAAHASPHPASPPPLPIEEPPAPPPPPKLPGLTPAFATASTAVPHTAAEPSRSMWDWPGPTRDTRRSSERAGSNAAAT